MTEGNPPNQFEELLEEVRKEVERTNSFPFSFSERAYLIKCTFLPKLLYVGRVALPPEPIINKFTRLMFRFFFGSDTAVGPGCGAPAEAARGVRAALHRYHSPPLGLAGAHDRN